MTLAELRRLIDEQNLDGQIVFAGCAQFMAWMAEMKPIERFSDPTVSKMGFPTLWSQWPERPRALIVLEGKMHPDESRVVKDFTVDA